MSHLNVAAEKEAKKTDEISRLHAARAAMQSSEDDLSQLSRERISKRAALTEEMFRKIAAKDPATAQRLRDVDQMEESGKAQEHYWVLVLRRVHAMFKLLGNIPIKDLPAETIEQTFKRAIVDAAETYILEKEAERTRTDDLTDLPGRAMMRYEMMKVLETTNTNIIFICIDLIAFKLINDSYRQGAGDQVLLEIADRMRAFSEMYSTKHEGMLRCLPARWGGDEFAIMLEVEPPDGRDAPSKDQVAQLLEDIQKHIFSDPITINIEVDEKVEGTENEKVTRKGTLTYVQKAKLGATVGDRTSTVADLVNEADRIMLSAKKLGRTEGDPLPPPNLLPLQNGVRLQY